MARRTDVNSDRTRIRRHPERGTSERGVVNAILDEGLVAHVGVVVDGAPVVIPMSYARSGDRLILHGSPASRLLRTLISGAPVCATVTLVDGIVVARSAFHSSMNYRSVVAFGRARRIEDVDEKDRALATLTEHVVPGRLAQVRASTAAELAATEVVELRIEDASAKVRTGPPRGEPAADRERPTWAGVIPLALVAGAPEPAPGLSAGTPAPENLACYRRPRRLPAKGSLGRP